MSDSYYQAKLEQGLLFQDHVADVLYENGIVVVGYVSKARGMKAENRLGIEVKRDGQFRKTGNLFIEIAEKSDPNKSDFTKSGIYRNDNSWLYAIGDECSLWIFCKKRLQELHQSKTYRELGAGQEQRGSDTARGFLLPVEDANRLCALKVCTILVKTENGTFEMRMRGDFAVQADIDIRWVVGQHQDQLREEFKRRGWIYELAPVVT